MSGSLARLGHHFRCRNRLAVSAIGPIRACQVGIARGAKPCVGVDQSSL